MNISDQFETLCLIYLYMLLLGTLHLAKGEVLNLDNYTDSNIVALCPSISVHEKLRG